MAAMEKGDDDDDLLLPRGLGKHCQEVIYVKPCFVTVLS